MFAYNDITACTGNQAKIAVLLGLSLLKAKGTRVIYVDQKLKKNI